MDEKNIPNQPLEESIPVPNPLPLVHEAVSRGFTTGKWELCFAVFIIILSILMCNFVLYGGFHLGFAITTVAIIICSAAYLKLSGHTFDWYTGSLLVLSLIIAAGFGRSGDGFVKFVMLLFLLVGVNLSLCITAGQNRRSPAGAASVLDAPRALFRMGFGGMGRSAQGVSHGIRNGGAATRKFGAVTTGLIISVPILMVLILLLTRADAAFEGLMDLLPEIRLEEYLTSALWGGFLGWVLYSRGVALHRSPKPMAAKNHRRGVNAVTVHTVLSAVCLVYCVYLFSQLAYLSGGLAGILPEEYTLAEYARRGFFEMAWLCALNLTIICGSVWLINKEGGVPLYTKLCGAFLGLLTIFLVTTASAKMLLYIGSYGLTRLRVLTEVIMLWLGLTTVFVTVWLFLPKLPYMKAVVLSAMVMGALVFWTDVDTVVARYNVESYQSGKLETVDVNHLSTLNVSAVPYLYELTQSADPEIAEEATRRLNQFARRYPNTDDWRSWNSAFAEAQEILENYREK